MEKLYTLPLTKGELELVMDSFKVSNQITRNLALKAAALVLEANADAATNRAKELTEAGWAKQLLIDEEATKRMMDDG